MTGKLPSRLQPWHNHVMKVKAQYPNKEFKEVLKIAKRTFHKQKKSLSRSLSGVEIDTNSYNIKVKSRKGKKLSKKVTRKASRKKSRRRKKRLFRFF